MQKYAVFRIAGEVFGITISRVVEIIREQKIFTLPGLPEFLSGVMNVRGTIIPLIDLRKRFAMQPSGGKQRVIIIRYEQEKIGFLVDDIKDILTLEKHEIVSPPSIFKGFRTEYLTGLGKKNDMIIILLNVDTILTSEEKIRLKETIGMIEGSDAGIDGKSG